MTFGLIAGAFVLLLMPPAAAQTETVLYTFPAGTYSPSALTFYRGNLYGATFLTSSNTVFNLGTLFELSPNSSGGWTENVLYTFCPQNVLCPGGEYPRTPPVFDSNGNIYGMTTQGGNSNCTLTDGCGVAFELVPGTGGTWTENVLYAFCSQGTVGTCPGADIPTGEGYSATVVTDSAGNLYSTDEAGVFELTPSAGEWTETVPSRKAAGLQRSFTPFLPSLPCSMARQWTPLWKRICFANGL